MSDTIKLIVEASGGQMAKVAVDDFLDQTKALMSALREIARITYGNDVANIRYRIEQLSTSSPLAAAFRGEMKNAEPMINFGAIHRNFGEGVAAILKGEDIPDFVNYQVFKSLRDYCSPIGGSVTGTEIQINGTGLRLDLGFRERINTINTQDKIDRGMFLKGMIEAANIHAESRTFFFLYPIHGPDRVRCIFPRELHEKVKAAFGHFVRVHGDFKYGWREHHPHEIKVKEIEILPRRDEMPDVRQMFGQAPNATGELTTEEFVENMRYG